MAGKTAPGGSLVIAGISPASASAMSASTPASRSASRSRLPERSDTSRSADSPPARISTWPRSLISSPPSRCVVPEARQPALLLAVPEARHLTQMEAGPWRRDTRNAAAAFGPAPAALVSSLELTEAVSLRRVRAGRAGQHGRARPGRAVSGRDGAERGPELDLGAHDLRQAAHPLPDPAGLGEAVGEPQVLGARPVGVEARPRHVRDPGGDGAGKHRLGVQARRELQPDVEPAGGPGPPAAIGHHRRQRLQHGVPAFPVKLTEDLHLLPPGLAGQVFADHELGEAGVAQ